MHLQRTDFMRVLITGANGFLGKNLHLWLGERTDIEVTTFTRANSLSELPKLVAEADFIFHLAGINRPQNPHEFYSDNYVLTREISVAVKQIAVNTGKKIPIVFASSIQANRDNDYGKSKRSAEEVLFAIGRDHAIPIYVFRLPNVFGKWCRPNYNSVVATFCHNIAHGLPIQIIDPTAPLLLVYIDDVISTFIALMDGFVGLKDDEGFCIVLPQYSKTVGEVAEIIHGIKLGRLNLSIDRVGTGLMRALYSTYISYLPPEDFAYKISQHVDARGVFVEILKTADSGQFSFFTAYPGVTRGGHYHHSKTEKFFVIQGNARFKFRHMDTGQTYELLTNGKKLEIVDTVPGWTHDITNVGGEELIVMVWANEVFDQARPDTYLCPLN